MKTKCKAKRLLTMLLALVMVVGLIPMTAFAEDGASEPNAVYVSNTGSDDTGNGTSDLPFATLAKAVNEANDGATIYLMSDLTINDCARYYSKHLTIKSTEGNRFTVTRGTEFKTLDDTERKWYNPAMIEVGGTPGSQDASLRLENITLDDNGLRNGSRFVQAGFDTGDNTNVVQDAMIATYNNTATITLGNGAILKNFGGMSAVRIADGILIMEAGSQIVDDKVSDRTKAGDDNGSAGAVWMQGGKIEMHNGSQISNVVGRAIYADGGAAVVNGTISGIVPDKEMWQGGAGLAIHARGNAEIVLGETGNISDITNSAKSVNADDAKVVATYGSNFEMKNRAEINGINNCTVFYADDLGNSYSHNMIINGKVYGCTTTNSLARSYYGLITIAPDSLITENTANGAGGLFYSNNGSHYLIEGKITKNIAANGMFYLANQSGGRVEATMKGNAEISENTGLGIRVNNGALFKMENGKITNNSDIAVRVTGKSGGNKNVSFVMEGGEISGNAGYGILYEFRNPDTQATVKLTGGKVENNNTGKGAQVSAVGGTACDHYEYLYIQKGVFKDLRSIETSFGTVTLDEEYPEIYIGTSSGNADSKIIELVKAQEGKESWKLYGSNGLWFKLTEDTALNFQTSKVSAENEIYAAYIPVDENGNAKADSQVVLLPLYNTNTIHVSLKKLEVGQSYALRFVESITPINKYTVTFDADGGSFPIESVPVSVTVNEGEQLNHSYWSEWAPVYQNEAGEDIHFFDGWYEVKSDGSLSDKAWTSADRVMGNVTLRAKWFDYVDVTFDANGGTLADGTENPVTVRAGETVAKPADPTAEGYTFKGWYADEKFSTAFDFENTAINQDTTIYAKWEKNAVKPTEPSKPSEPTTPTKPSEPTKPAETNPNTGVEVPNTGDNSNMAFWIALLFVSAAGVFGTTVYAKKKKSMR